MAVARRPKRRARPKTTTRPAAPAAEETVTIKIGHAGPLTGGIAHLGKDDENGVHLAVDEANDKKIKIGGKTVKFEMMSEDDQADPKLGPTIAQKFVDAKVAGVIGHLNSGVSIPASAVYNQAGLAMISGSATNPKLTEQGFKDIFRTVGRDDQQGPPSPPTSPTSSSSRRSRSRTTPRRTAKASPTRSRRRSRPRACRW
jgi:branched-chain amino acid transport system substrate-binding protein